MLIHSSVQNGRHTKAIFCSFFFFFFLFFVFFFLLSSSFNLLFKYFLSLFAVHATSHPFCLSPSILSFCSSSLSYLSPYFILCSLSLFFSLFFLSFVYPFPFFLFPLSFCSSFSLSCSLTLSPFHLIPSPPYSLSRDFPA